MAQNSQKPKNSTHTIFSSCFSCLTKFFIFALFFSVIAGVILSVVGGMWLQTYEEIPSDQDGTLIGIVDTKYINDNTYKLTLTPVENPSALTALMVSKQDSQPSEKEKITRRLDYEIKGDSFSIDVDVIETENNFPVTKLGIIYKIVTIYGVNDGDFTDTYDINGGTDAMWQTINYNQDTLEARVKSAYTSSVTQELSESDQTWGLYLSERGSTTRLYKR